jgi:pyruvate,water dikinase
VLVQEMVPTRAAGVLVTRDPAGLPDTILVNATWGLGETIGQGETTGDLYWVRRSTGEAVATETDAAVHRVELDPERPGTVVVPLAPDQVGRPCLSESDLARLAELSRALELATGRGQDVEFGFTHDGALVLFQSRRIRGRIDRRERAAAP